MNLLNVAVSTHDLEGDRVRLNCGCGSVQPDGWVNADRREYGQDIILDVRDGHACEPYAGMFDVIVANHLLSCFNHHELPGVLENIRSMLKPGGVLRVLVPDMRAAARAYLCGDTNWFPQGDDMPSVSERYCTYVTWFGESPSIFDASYLGNRLYAGGFTELAGPLQCGQTVLGPKGSGELDDRCRMSLIMEARTA